VGFFDGFWATSVAIKVINYNRVHVDTLSEQQMRTLKVMSISLKDKGMSKDEALSAINQLAIEHGGLVPALNFYSENFRI